LQKSPPKLLVTETKKTIGKMQNGKAAALESINYEIFDAGGVTISMRSWTTSSRI
jgi:hypothetical protein